MKIAVIGAGNTGTALAASLSLRAHEVTLIKTSQALHEDSFSYLSANGGRVTLEEADTQALAVIPRVTRDLADAVAAEVVLVCTRTDSHEDVLRRLAPHLSAGQILLLIPGYLSTAYALRYCRPDIVIAEAQSAFLDCRIVAPGRVRIGFRNVRNPVGVYPACRTAEAAEQLDRLGFPLTYLRSVVEAALHNPNMIVHPVGALMSLPRVEKTGGDYCMYHEVFTPSVWRMLEALDREKCGVLAALGLPPVSYADACKYRNTLEESADGRAVFFDYAAMPTRANGPSGPEDRYLTEDVPQGLVLLESLAARAGVPTPVCTALIGLSSVALCRDLRREGRTVARLGEAYVRKILGELAG